MQEQQWTFAFRLAQLFSFWISLQPCQEKEHMSLLWCSVTSRAHFMYSLPYLTVAWWWRSRRQECPPQHYWKPSKWSHNSNWDLVRDEGNHVSTLLALLFLVGIFFCTGTKRKCIEHCVWILAGVFDLTICIIFNCIYILPATNMKYESAHPIKQHQTSH